MRTRITIGVVFSLILAVMLGAFVFAGRRGDAAPEKDVIAPAIPRNFSLSTLDGQYTLQWIENEEWDLFSYVVYIRTSEDVKPTDEILTGQRDSYTLSDLEPNTAYFVSLAARDNAGNVSKPTSEIGFTYTGDSQEKSTVLDASILNSSSLTDSLRSFELESDLYSVVTPEMYEVNGDGSLVQDEQVFTSDLQLIAQENEISVLPVVSADGSSEEFIQLLDDSEQRGRHANVIAQEVVNREFDGVTVSYQNLPLSSRSSFSQFVRELGVLLDKEDKVLMVSVRPKRSEAQDWDGVQGFDFQAIGNHADYVRLLTYDYSRENTAAGPIAPVTWFKESIEYASERIPAEKLIVAVGYHGYSWCAGEGECEVERLSWDEVQSIVAAHTVKVEWDTEAQVPWFAYTDSEEQSRVVYFENDRSISAKLAVISNDEIGGVSLVNAFGFDPESFSRVRTDFASDESSGGLGIVLTPQDEAITVGWSESESAAVGHRIYYRQKGEEERFVDVFDAYEHTLTKLTNEEIYFVEVLPLTANDAQFETLESGQEDVRRKTFEYVVSPRDVVGPARVDDLHVEKIGSDTLDISFTVPGDDEFRGEAGTIDLRVSEEKITAETFDSADTYDFVPEFDGSGYVQYWQLRGLSSGKEYYVALTFADEAGNVSPVSNILQVSTIDIVPPRPPVLQSSEVGDSIVAVSWDASKSDDVAGYSLFFREGFGDYEEIVLDPDETTYSLEGLTNNVEYSLYVRAFDDSGNESPKTPVIVVVPHRETVFSQLNDLLSFEKDKIQGSVFVFANRLQSEQFVPYLVMAGFVLLNVFLLYSFRKEILSVLHARSGYGDTDVSNKPQTMVDLRKK